MLTSTKDYHSHLAKNSEVAIIMSIVFMVYEGRGKLIQVINFPLI